MDATKAPTGGPTAAGALREKTPLYSHYVLFVLCVANILSIADRNIMGILLEPIKRDLHASDTIMSLLTGASFVVFYSIFGVPIARWSDTGNRRNILALGVGLWSLMTAACGVAGNVATMALARAGVGVGEATCTPTSMSLIWDYYRKAVRPQAVASFQVMAFAGSILVTPMIGILTDTYSWRTAFIVLGVPGVLVSLLLLTTVREPVRGAADGPGAAKVTPIKFSEALRELLKSRAFMLLLLGTAISGMGAGTFVAWGYALMMRAFQVSSTQVATFAAPIGAMGGIAGVLLGGFLTGWLARRLKSDRWLVLGPAYIGLLSVPAGLFVNFGPTWAWTIVGMTLGSFSTGFRAAPFLALMIDQVPANCRGLASAASVIATSLVGSAGGPLIVGLISDHLTPSIGAAAALRWAFVFAPVTLALGAIPFFMVARHIGDRTGDKG